MKSTLLFLFIAVFTVTGFRMYGQTDNPVEKKVDIEWTGTKHDFGEIQQNVPAIYTFEFKNKGENPVVILGAKASCGCTVPKYSKEPVRPGETGSIEVKYDSRRIGTFSKSVKVTIDGMERPEILFISGSVVTEKSSD